MLKDLLEGKLGSADARYVIRAVTEVFARKQGITKVLLSQLSDAVFFDLERKKI